jgi:endonuclease YncB( thermonuclease family)
MTTARKPPPLILLAIPAAILLACQSRAENTPAPASVALVERVVDGDTVVVRLDCQSVKVRLIGVDAPESVDPRKPVQRFGHESADFLRRLVEGKRVRLAYVCVATLIGAKPRFLSRIAEAVERTPAHRLS